MNILAEVPAVLIPVCLLMSAPAKADCGYAVPLGVEVNLEKIVMLTRLFQPEKPQVENYVREALTRELERIFPYWCFESSSRQHRPQLEFSMFVYKKSVVRLQVALKSGEEFLGDPLVHTFLNPNQFDQIPRIAEQPRQRLSRAFRMNLLVQNLDRTYLRELLMKNIPVTTTGQWRAGKHSFPSLVLPLPWEPNFKNLQFSKFRLLCRRLGRPNLQFEANGSSDPGLYPVKRHSGESPYEALQVFPESQTNTKELARYRPRIVYLKKFVRAIDGMMALGPSPGTSP